MTQKYRQTISKEEINEMPLYETGGKRIIIVDDLETAYEECMKLRERDILGFDTETRPSFRKGETHQISLLQLADDECCWLFRLNKIGLPGHLADLLANPHPLKIGVSIKDDILRIRGRVAGLKPAGFIELQNEVKRVGIEEMSLQKIYAIMFGKKISKSSRLSNWDADELTQKQQEYAALDAWACLDIFYRLSNDL